MEAFSSYMDVENSRTYIDQLYSNDPEKYLEAVSELKFVVIGNLREKAAIIEQGVVARLLQILRAPDSEIPMRTEVAVVLNSLAKGLPEHAAALVQAGLLPILWEQLESCATSSQNKYTQMILCCLRSVYKQGCAPPPPAWNHKLLTTLIQYGYQPPSNQECVANILAYALKTSEQQQQLVDAGCADLVATMLCSSFLKVQLPALHCLAALCYNNPSVSSIIVSKSHGEKYVPDILSDLVSRDKSNEMQLAAAICLTFLYRAGGLSADDPRIMYKTLQVLARLCHSDCALWERVEASQTLAYLTEVNTELQRIAAYTDRLPELMRDLMKFECKSSDPVITSPSYFIPVYCRNYSDPTKWPQLAREAAFRVLASLAANDEEIRLKVRGPEEELMQAIVTALTAGTSGEQLAAVRCLLSLSRSVHVLRTTFQDHQMWKPLMSILKTTSEELVSAASAALCNLLLEFSPSKEEILNQGIVEFLCGLTRRPASGIRLNAVWALMSMAYRTEHRVKVSILHHLGTDQIFQLLSDSDVQILMKTLGLLRNLLSTKSHIDLIMQGHGKEIMQAVILILEGDHPADVKEQALCILANIAHGDLAKSAIMSNEDVLKKLMNYMLSSNVKLQIAATFCISNLIWNTEVGAGERQSRLKELGVSRILENLLTTPDPSLFDRVKTAVDQFMHGNNSGGGGSSSSSSWKCSLAETSQ